MKQITAVAGSATFAGAGVAGQITITPATDLELCDIVFTGTAAGGVRSITVGDRLAWSSSTPVPAAIFGPTGTVRGVLQGQEARAGVPIVVEVVSGGAETITATVIARKPGCR